MIYRIILYIKSFKAKLCPKVFGLYEGGKPCIQSHSGMALYREEICITPQALWAVLNPFAGNVPFDLIVVIIYLERPKTELTDMKRNRGIHLPALPAL